MIVPVFRQMCKNAKKAHAEICVVHTDHDIKISQKTHVLTYILKSFRETDTMRVSETNILSFSSYSFQHNNLRSIK